MPLRCSLPRSLMVALACAAGSAVAVPAWLESSVHAQTSQPAQPPTRPGQTPPSRPGTPAPTKPGTPAAAQPPAKATPPANQAPPALGKAFMESIVSRGRANDWTIRMNLVVLSFQSGAQGTAITPQNLPDPKDTRIAAFKFETGALVYPMPLTTAGSKSEPVMIESKLRLDGKDIMSTRGVVSNLPCGASYGRWDMKNVAGRMIEFDIDIPMQTWETKFDEAKAMQVPWPKSGRWGAQGTQSLGPQLGVDIGPVVQDKLKAWTAGKAPQEIPPAQFAKYIAGRVQEALQPSGDGMSSGRVGALQGFSLKGSERTLQDGRGSPHDIVCALVALYRAAGLPARVVVGLDLSKVQGSDRGLAASQGTGEIYSWAEFSLYDEGSRTEIWVPVDINRIRGSSSKAGQLTRPWNYFGSHDRLQDIAPIAFHFHPPIAGVIAHGAPGIWGWMTTPEAQHAEQQLRLSAMFTPRGARRQQSPTSPMVPGK